MTTWTALTTLPGRDRAEALAEAFEGLEPEPIGVGIFEVEDGSGLWEVGGYFTEPPDTVALALLEIVHASAPIVVSEVPEVDWVAKVRRDLAPVEAGRFFVHGSHDADRVPAGREALLIEAAMAFGTGHHGTTLGCLRAIDRLADEGFVPAGVADIGCGTAVLAMAAARVWECPVIASDIDSVAVEVSAANVVANGLAGRIDCVVAAGFAHDAIAARAPFDLVLANILKGPLIELAPAVARHTRAGGFAILSGILNEQAEEVIKVYSHSGFNLANREEIVDWTTLTLHRSV
jgi:ribosomal protein L11 methyltransferase